MALDKVQMLICFGYTRANLNFFIKRAVSDYDNLSKEQKNPFFKNKNSSHWAIFYRFNHVFSPLPLTSARTAAVTGIR